MKRRNDLRVLPTTRTIRYGVLLFLLIPNIYGADDNESWTSIGFEKKLPYKLKLEFEQELRFKDQISTFKQTFSDISLSYKVFDGLRIQIPYRYIVYKDKIKQRLSFSGSYKYSFKPVDLKYRTKFQCTYEDKESTDDMIRNKFSVQYKLGKKVEPYISGELFHPYNGEPKQLDEYRISFGLTVDIMKKNSIKIFYIFKKEDLNSDPYDVNIFGLAYSFNW
ncbi:MAG TPA: DUF2490 domain-containing protein [Candidatus Marinimicrobia bacterium]|nr:DUF2490 domain-containing protein [Candidatus Neomarinimicrobiota bacterium]